jgi:YVTN family beta-propeller protein
MRWVLAVCGVWAAAAAAAQCPAGEFADCSGTCRPEALLEFVGDFHCHRGFWLGGGWALGPASLNLDCAEFGYDGSDCVFRGCTDPAAVDWVPTAEVNDGTCDPPPASPPAFAHAVTGTYTTGVSPRGLCVLPDGSKAYVGTNTGISVIVSEGPEGCDPSVATVPGIGGIVYSCTSILEGTRAVCPNWTTGKLVVLNTATDAVVAQVPVGVNPLKAWPSPDGSRVYVTNNGSNTVSVVNTVTWTTVATWGVGQGPRNCATTPDGALLFVADWTDHAVRAVNTVNGVTVGVLPVDFWPQAVCPLPDGEHVLVGNFGFDHSKDHFTVVRVDGLEPVARLQCGLGPEDAVVSPDGNWLYVSEWGMSCCFSVASDACCTATGNSLTRVSVVELPDFSAYPGGGEVPWVDATVHSIPTNGRYAFGLAVAEETGEVWVAEKDSHRALRLGFSPTATAALGESCANAIPLVSLNYCISGSTTCMQDDHNFACPFTATGGRDVVYRFTPTVDVTRTFDLCDAPFDTKLYIASGGCPAPGQPWNVAWCNDDACGVNGWRSRLENVAFEAGTTYHIVVDGFGTADAGAYTVCFDVECPEDLDASGTQDTADLLLLLDGFGGQFDVSHVLAFIAAYGLPCP